MQKKIPITEAELPIMQALWARAGGATSPEIFEATPGNKSTLKTLLARLAQKGAVRTEEINQRNYRYFAVVREEEYIAAQRKSLLQGAFGGSAEKMLLNFVQAEHISAESLKRLAALIEEGE